MPQTLVRLGAAVVAWRSGGGADARAPLPRSPESPASPPNGAAPARARGAEAYEVRTRLVDALDEARIDAPNLAAAQPSFQNYWRKMRGPWGPPGGVAAQLVTTLSLRTSAEETSSSGHD